MRTLPDHLRKGMKLVIVGCNPTDSSVRVGHYYAGRDNPFWPTLFDSGVIPEPFDYHDDKRVIEFAIGLTDLVKKPTKTPDMLSREDFAEGRIVLSQKLEEFAPRVVAFNGKLTYEQFAQRKCKCGLQKERLYGARVFVLPATPAPQSQSAKEKKDAILHFRKLAQLVKRVEKEHDAAPLQGNRFANTRTSSHPANFEHKDHDDREDSGDPDAA
jgi:mismatch-specific thymine-DNA glycosylase